MKSSLVVATWALAVAGCGGVAVGGPVGGGGGGGGGAGGQSVTGTVGGKPLPTLNDSIGIIQTNSTSSPSPPSPGGGAGGGNSQVIGVDVALTNVPDVCTILQQNANPANATALAFSVSTVGAQPSTGTYAIRPVTSGNAASAIASYSVQDAHCQSTMSEDATSGTITFSTISATTIDGSFDVTFPGGDHLSGTFSAPVCNANLSGGRGAPTCVTTTH